MAITVNWATRRVFVPQADLTLADSGPPALYTLDTEAFRRELKALEASEAGMPNVDITQHFTTYTVAGTEYARAIIVTNGYQIEFEDGQYSVILQGSNNNIFDSQNSILVRNQVQVIPTNAAGLVVVDNPNAPTAGQVADAVWDETAADHSTPGTFGRVMKAVEQNSL